MRHYKKQYTICIFVFGLIYSSLTLAERYSVQEDSFGNVIADKVERDVDEKKASNNVQAASVSSDNAILDSSTSNAASSELSINAEEGIITEEHIVNDEHLVADEKESIQKTDDAIANSASNSQEGDAQPNIDPVLGDTGKELSPFEKAYIETAKKERERVLDRIKDAPEGEVYDATEVKSLDFIDGDDLLKGKGSVVKPYYTVVDADGRYKNVFYDPERLQETLDQIGRSNVQLTPATVFTGTDESVSQLGNAQPKALDILLGGADSKNFFDEFSKLCCANLPNIDVGVLEPSKSHYADINRQLLPIRLYEGDSRFVLMKLPDVSNEDAFTVAVRSFVKDHRKEGVERGVFYPHLATLDADKKPLRIFTEPLLSYTDETWLKHGFLEGFFRIKDSLESNEVYLLVYTSKKQILTETIVDSKEDGELIIKNMAIGSVEVEVLLDAQQQLISCCF